MDGFPFELPVAGLSGFAFGLVVSSIWLYILTPCRRQP